MAGPLTIADLDNGKLDLETISDVTNLGPDVTVTSRLGQLIKTVSQAIQDVGFIDLQPWVTATVYDDYQILIEEGGFTYTLNQQHTSGVFATDLADGKWALYIPPGSLLGTSAFLDVLETQTDSTVDRVHKNGSWGLGGTAPDAPADLDSIVNTGFFKFTSTTLNIPEAFDGVLIHTQGDAASLNIRAWQVVRNANNNAFSRNNNNGVWSAWEANDADSFAKSFGLGTISSNAGVVDANTLILNGYYYVDAASTNIPTAQVGYLNVEGAGNSNNLVQTYVQRTSDRTKYRRRNVGGTWESWEKVDPQAFGLGAAGLNTGITDADTITSSGYFWFNPGITNGPSSSFPSVVHVVSVSSASTDSEANRRISQIAYDYVNNITRTRTRTNATVWTAWVETGVSFGLGSSEQVLSTDLNNETITKYGRYDLSTLNKPAGAAFGTYQTIAETGTNATQFSYGRLNNGEIIHVRRRVGASSWTAWIAIYPQAYGWGIDLDTTNPPSVGNLNNAIVSGMYRFDSGATNAPAAVGSGSFIVIGYGSQNIKQMAVLNGSSNEYFIRSKLGALWSNWFRMDPQAYGLDTNINAGVVDLDTLITTTFQIVQAGSTNSPIAGGGYLSVQRQSTINVYQVFVSLSGTLEKFERRQISGVWEAWVVVGGGGGSTTKGFTCMIDLSPGPTIAIREFEALAGSPNITLNTSSYDGSTGRFTFTINDPDNDFTLTSKQRRTCNPCFPSNSMTGGFWPGGETNKLYLPYSRELGNQSSPSVVDNEFYLMYTEESGGGFPNPTNPNMLTTWELRYEWD